MKKTALVAAILVALIGASYARAGTVVTVMTRNLYFGTDLTPVVTSQSQSQFFTAVATAYSEAQASNFSGRLNRVADEIAATRPDLVGLQEAVQWRTQFPADFIPLNAQTDAGNFVPILLGALAARGLDYVVASEATGYDVEAPGAFPGPFPLFTDVRLTQHEVILARRGLGLSNAQSGRYAAADIIPSVVGPIVLPWAWASVDVTKAGQTFRFGTTHLDSNVGATQQAQAQEFVGGPGNTPLPLVWVGDFNSAAAASGATDVPPDTPTHNQVVAAGFTDAWAATRSDDPGFTCCNAENLLNPTPTYTDRIDYVFSRGAVRPIGALRVGVLPLERISTGQWPSDHAGVFAALIVG
jgi:endonuclease/exonuclease/phosphatase family metal-dependent hydrolase